HWDQQAYGWSTVWRLVTTLADSGLGTDTDSMPWPAPDVHSALALPRRIRHARRAPDKHRRMQEARRSKNAIIVPRGHAAAQANRRRPGALASVRRRWGRCAGWRPSPVRTRMSTDAGRHR